MFPSEPVNRILFLYIDLYVEICLDSVLNKSWITTYMGAPGTTKAAEVRFR